MSVGAVNKQTGDRIPTAGLPAVDSVLSGTSTNPVQNKVVKEALDGKADTDMVAADFSTTASYTAGNYCVYDGKLYKFKNNHSGAWSSADVDEVKITGELSALKSGLINHAFTETVITSGNIDTYLDEYRYAFIMVTVPSQDWSVLTNWAGNFDGFIIKIGDVALAFNTWSTTEMPWFKYKWGSGWTGWIKFS